MREDPALRVIVVGAGLSGLACAYRLHEAGLDVSVLEARARPGGRAWSVALGEVYEFDAGGEALDDAHTTLLALAGELGVRTLRAQAWAGLGEPGLPLWLIGGRRSAGEPPLEEGGVALLRALDDEVSGLARRLDPDRPEDAEGAAQLDRTSLGSWLRGRAASSAVLAVAETWYSVASAGVPIERMSLLALAAKRAAGAAPGGLRLRLDGGPSALCRELAARLEGRLRLGAEVAAVEQGSREVVVRLADGSVERAARAVLAIPLTAQRRLRFDPTLPAERRRALAEARYGEVVKAGLLFDDAFWPEDEPPVVLSERGLVYAPRPDQPLLCVFAGSGAARSLERELPGLLSDAVGEHRTRAAASVDWSEEPFSWGSYLILGPGELTLWGRRLREPHGLVHFAGSEASSLPSYLEGAVRAAERCAAEVLASSALF